MYGEVQCQCRPISLDNIAQFGVRAIILLGGLIAFTFSVRYND